MLRLAARRCARQCCQLWIASVYEMEGHRFESCRVRSVCRRGAACQADSPADSRCRIHGAQRSFGAAGDKRRSRNHRAAPSCQAEGERESGPTAAAARNRLLHLRRHDRAHGRRQYARDRAGRCFRASAGSRCRGHGELPLIGLPGTSDPSGGPDFRYGRAATSRPFGLSADGSPCLPYAFAPPSWRPWSACVIRLLRVRESSPPPCAADLRSGEPSSASLNPWLEGLRKRG